MKQYIEYIRCGDDGKPELSPELIKKLIDAGLTTPQATSKAAKVTVHTIMEMCAKDSAALAEEAVRTVRDAAIAVDHLKNDYDEAKRSFDDRLSAFDEVVKTFQEFAEPKDQKAKDAISLYATMLSLGKRYGAQPETIVNNAGYVLYAYLGGQARREITQADFLKGNNTK